jgi:hypothetical protein
LRGSPPRINKLFNAGCRKFDSATKLLFGHRQDFDRKSLDVLSLVRYRPMALPNTLFKLVLSSWNGILKGRLYSGWR